MFNFQVFNSYKIKKCKNNDCLKKKNKKDLENCIFYHSESDKRRYPLKINIDDLCKNTELLEKHKNSNYLISDFFCEYEKIKKNKIKISYNNIMLRKKNKQLSKNVFEKNFHPYNFKSKKCRSKNCEKKYCYSFHNKNEKIDFEKFKENLKKNEIKMELKNCYNFIQAKRIRKIKKKKIRISNSIKIIYKKILQQKFIILGRKKNTEKKYYLNQKLDNTKNLIQFENSNKKHNNLLKKENLKIKHKENKEINSLVELVSNNICGFLNSKFINLKKKIYLGISEKKVKGILLNRKKIDNLRWKLDCCLRDFNPPVFESRFQINFFEIFQTYKFLKKIENLFVLEIVIYKEKISGNNYEILEPIYFNHHKQFYLEENEKLIHLSNFEITRFIRKKYLKK